MVDIIKDKYILGQSEKKSINLPGEEIRLDLNLSIDGTDSIGGIVTGVVEDGFGVPINGALVKLMSADYDPVMHAITDVTGTYTLNNVPIDKTFRIYAIAPGKKLKEGSIIAATLGKKLKMDFTLDVDPSKQLAVIAGDVLDTNSKDAVEGAIASLYSINASGQSLVAVTDTNKYGQFTFREVALGSYNVVVTSFGYFANEVLVTASAQGQIIPLKINLIQDPNNSKGTVSGVIKNEVGDPIDNGDVILYRVEEDGSLTPVAFTKTNSEGVYLFENVPQATYKIKSNESTTVTVVAPNSPSYYGFSIANASSLNPKIIYVSSESDLYQGAKLELDDSFVTGIGGAIGGSMEIGITPDYPGYFDVNIRYLSGNTDTTIILQEDPDNDGIQRILDFPKTNSWGAADAKTITVKLPMQNGQNRYKLYNNENEATPWIGDFALKYTPYLTEVDLARADQTGVKVINGATKLYPFITNIGGPTKGAVYFTGSDFFNQPYRLEIEYLAGDEDRPIKIDVNGTNQVDVKLPKTLDWNYANRKTYEVEVIADEGENEFIFYNDTGAYAANIGALTFNEYTINKTFLPKDVVLLEGIELKKDATGTDYIDGVIQGRGQIKFTLTVHEQQLYDFKILYKCNDDRVCSVKVNDNLVEYATFEFKATGNQVGEFYEKLFLDKGENTVIIYNE